MVASLFIFLCSSAGTDGPQLWCPTDPKLLGGTSQQVTACLLHEVTLLALYQAKVSGREHSFLAAYTAAHTAYLADWTADAHMNSLTAWWKAHACVVLSWSPKDAITMGALRAGDSIRHRGDKKSWTGMRHAECLGLFGNLSWLQPLAVLPSRAAAVTSGLLAVAWRSHASPESALCTPGLVVPALKLLLAEAGSSSAFKARCYAAQQAWGWCRHESCTVAACAATSLSLTVKTSQV